MNLISGKMIDKFIYSIAGKSFILAAKLISPFNIRAKKLIDSRKTSFHFPAKRKNEIRVWLHVASLGEFEQARPVIELLKQEISGLQVFTSFFSPSGYETRCFDKLNDYAFYLPFESTKNAESIIANLNPDFAIWVKYDFWLIYLNKLFQKKIPVFLISAQFRRDQIYFGSLGKPYRDAFKMFSLIMNQTKESLLLLNEFHIKNSIVTGDPRIDRVIIGKKNVKSIPFITEFKNNQRTIICGSSYRIEEEILADFLSKNKNIKCIIAPHFVDDINIKEIRSLFPKSKRYSEIENVNQLPEQVLIIDSIGKLSSLYQYADFGFIGGGFKQGGLHNILEAIVYKIPVSFGPKINRFPEAIDLVDKKLANTISNITEFNIWINNLLKNESVIKDRNQELTIWLELNAGAAKKTQLEISNVLNQLS